MTKVLFIKRFDVKRCTLTCRFSLCLLRYQDKLKDAKCKTQDAVSGRSKLKAIYRRCINKQCGRTCI